MNAFDFIIPNSVTILLTIQPTEETEEQDFIVTTEYVDAAERYLENYYKNAPDSIKNVIIVARNSADRDTLLAGLKEMTPNKDTLGVLNVIGELYFAFDASLSPDE